MSVTLVLLGAGGAFEDSEGLGDSTVSWDDHPIPCPFRMRLCTSATESEVLRGKNILRNALVSHLDGECSSPVGRRWSASWQGQPQCSHHSQLRWERQTLKAMPYPTPTPRGLACQIQVWVGQVNNSPSLR